MESDVAHHAGVKQLMSAIAGTEHHGGLETLSPARTARQLSKLRAGQALQKAGALTQASLLSQRGRLNLNYIKTRDS